MTKGRQRKPSGRWLKTPAGGGAALVCVAPPLIQSGGVATAGMSPRTCKASRGQDAPTRQPNIRRMRR